MIRRCSATGGWQLLTRKSMACFQRRGGRVLRGPRPQLSAVEGWQLPSSTEEGWCVGHGTVLGSPVTLLFPLPLFILPSLETVLLDDIKMSCLRYSRAGLLFLAFLAAPPATQASDHALPRPPSGPLLVSPPLPGMSSLSSAPYQVAILPAAQGTSLRWNWLL